MGNKVIKTIPPPDGRKVENIYEVDGKVVVEVKKKET